MLIAAATDSERHCSHWSTTSKHPALRRISYGNPATGHNFFAQKLTLENDKRFMPRSFFYVSYFGHLLLSGAVRCRQLLLMRIVYGSEAVRSCSIIYTQRLVLNLLLRRSQTVLCFKHSSQADSYTTSSTT